MSDLLSIDEARQTLRRLTVIAFEANRTLQDSLHHPDRPPTYEQICVRQRILEELVRMREGFLLALKTDQVVDSTELRDFLKLLIDWTWLNELGLSWQTDAPIERLNNQVILHQHALIAMGILPRLPSEAITFPGRNPNKYSDIDPPGTPGATLTRLEELERVMWRATSEPLAALPGGAVRRTYGFFEATTWLARHHLRGMVGW
jgi:hypothetical protein